LLLLRENKLGHANQVEGLAAIIARMTEVAVDRIEVRRRRLPLKSLQNWLVARFPHWGPHWLRTFYGIDLGRMARPDVIVGSGDITIAVGILASRITGAKFVLAGDPKGYDTRDIGLVIVHSPRLAGDPNCVFAPIPCTTDPERLPKPRPLRRLADLPEARVALLIGGNAGGYVYSDQDWHALAQLVTATRELLGLRWSVSNSRRTPDMASRLFERLAANGEIEHFVDFRMNGPGSSRDLLAADAIVVTEDSRSMMAEAMAARRPVILMRPQKVSHSLGTERVAATVAAGGVVVLPIRTASAEQFARTLLAIRVPAQDPRDVLAAAIAPVLGLAGAGPDAAAGSG